MTYSKPAAAILVLLTLTAGTTTAGTPADPQALPVTARVLDMITAIPGEGTIIAGQQIGLNEGFTTYGAAAGYPHYITALGAVADRVGLIGADYCYSWAPNKGSLHDVNQPLINHWNGGGLVSVMLSARNPWTGGTHNDQTGVNLAELLTAGTDANRAWIAQLDEAATGLAELQAAGVVVLFRPLHESNGNWFWWGKNATTPTVSVADVWRNLFTYFTVTKGLHNLLWVYAVSTTLNAQQADVLDYYPGDAFVDIVGLDIYHDTFMDPDNISCAQLRTTGKPFALAEFGPGVDSGAAASFDYRTMLPGLTAKLPGTAYFLCWNDWSGQSTQYKSLVSNQHADDLLLDDVILSRAAIAARLTAIACDDATIAPAAFSLSPNYPNPFNPATAIPFTLPTDGHVTLRIYNALGQFVAELADGRFAAGSHTLVWNGRDSAGMTVSTGVYHYVLTVDGQSITRSMTLAK